MSGAADESSGVRADAIGLRVDVYPERALLQRARLFADLEELVGVRFRPGRGFGTLPHAVVDLDGSATRVPPGIPTFRSTTPGRAPRRTEVRLSAGGLVPPPLRARTVSDVDAGRCSALLASEGMVVLAETAEGPAWAVETRDGRPVHITSCAPDELVEGESLRARLAGGRFLSVLALVEFLRSLAGLQVFSPPPPRAAFVVDDPNLHSSSYGHIRYPDLAALAAAHGFHVAFATVPIDGWLVRDAAARWFRGMDSRLSLVVHGNDHVHRELARDRPDEVGYAELAQSLRRIASIERRAGVRVGRVMVPPHGACSAATLRRLGRIGFEALCASRPFPWLDGPPPEAPLASLGPADVVEGTPVISRLHLDCDREDLLMRAYLGQPLILYGHHGDAASDLDAFVEAAGFVNGIGGVDWLPLDAIVRSSFLTRLQEGILHVRPQARRVLIRVPAGATAIKLDLTDARVELETASGHLEGCGPHPVREGETITLRIPYRDEVDPVGIPDPPRRLWPIARRLLVEARDRSSSVTTKVRERRSQPRREA